MTAVFLSRDSERLLTATYASDCVSNLDTIKNEPHILFDRTDGNVGESNRAGIRDTRVETGRQSQRDDIDGECQTFILRFIDAGQV